MLCLGWVFLWFVAGEKTTGFNHSGMGFLLHINTASLVVKI
jgi:hypothetical protein